LLLEKETTVKTSTFASALLLGSLISCSATAQEWPTRPVKILVGSAPGGGTDAMARAVADRLGPLLKQPVVVENKPGASNTLAADATAKSTDGHTLIMGVSTAHAIAPHLLKLGYDSNRDLVPVAFVGSVPNVLVASNALGVSDVASLVKLAKSQPGQLNYASSGAGSTQHIAAELFKEATGVFITHIPYRGSGPAIVDLIGGQVQMSFDTLPSVLGQIKAGKMKALAVAAPKRNPQLPTVPTLAEAGVKGVEMSAWYGIYMPANTPKAVQDRVLVEVNKVLAMPETVARLDGIGADINSMTQAKFLEFHNAEYKRFGDLIARKNIKLDQ
jgi:tripartite-type tricarboxylate transporter receptor subunit TctC